jgi:hypothetical protein
MVQTQLQVLEGELAQRAEKTRQLREIQKQLMLLGGLVPPSPLVTQQPGAPPHSPRSTEDGLLSKQQRLQAAITKHSDSIRVGVDTGMYASCSSFRGLFALPAGL